MPSRLPIVALLTGVLFFAGISAIEDDNDCTRPVLSLTFDDGYENVYEQAAPILADHGVTATTYVITDHVGGTFENRSLMTWAQLEELHDRGWEIGSHTHTHPAMDTVSDDQLQDEINTSYATLQDRGLDPQTLAAPYGYSSSRVREAVMDRFDGFRITDWGPNNITDPDRGALKAYWLTADQSWSKTRPDVRDGLQTDGWAIIMLHSVSNTSSYHYNIDPATLEAIIAFAERNDIDIKPVAEVLREC